MAEPEEVKRVRLKPLPARFKIYYEKKIGLSETKLFHFHGIFKKK